MTNISKEGYKPRYQKSYIQLESIADKAEAARIANGTVKEHQPKRVTDEAVERMSNSDKAHLRVTDYDRMRELYDQGMTDGKIAREMGLVDQSLVRKWRDRYDIPAHGNQKRVPKFNQDLAMQMYQDGSSDRQIAAAMGVDRTMAYQWRKKEGLKPMNAGMQNKIDSEAAGKEVALPVIDTASLEDVIEEKNAIIQDLLVKNAELSGFIEGVKFVFNMNGGMAG